MLSWSICEDDEFAHDGGYGDFWGPSASDERMVLGLEIGIEAEGDEGRHGEDLAQACAAAAD